MSDLRAAASAADARIDAGFATMPACGHEDTAIRSLWVGCDIDPQEATQLVEQWTVRAARVVLCGVREGHDFTEAIAMSMQASLTQALLTGLLAERGAP